MATTVPTNLNGALLNPMTNIFFSKFWVKNVKIRLKGKS